MKQARVVAVAICCVSFVLHASAGPKDNRLDVYWIDVEGGGATLIVTPAGESVLIDTGYPDVGPARIHKVAAGVVGLRRIDHLIVTHFHNDHYGSAVELSKLIPIVHVWDNGAPMVAPDPKEAPAIEAYQAFARDKRTVVKPGDTIPLKRAPGSAPLTLRLIGARQQVVAAPAGATPNPACANAAAQPDDPTDNAASTAWVLEFGSFRFFDGGDLTRKAEARVVCPVNLVGRVDVYQVDHHGLDLSNNPLLLRSLSPTVTVMNNGARKGTGSETIAALRAVTSIAANYQVHKNVRDGEAANNTADALIANIPEQCAGGHIRMSVEPDGKRYTIEIPGTGHRRQFAVR
jgi:competence protein ComEC